MLMKIKALFPGSFIAVITGLAALFLAEYYNAPAMLFALLLGIALSFLHEETKCKAGIEFTASTVLRIGVALLGFRIAFDDLMSLGWSTALLLIAAISSTIIVGVLLSRVMGMSRRFGMLTGGSVAICGASAAMAISAILPNDKNKERDTLLTIIGVTSLSTIAMVLYPIIATKLGLTEHDTSIFLGGTIHDVAQVVGAGYSVSEQTGDLSTLVKLVRVSFLMPVVLMMLLALREQCKHDKQVDHKPHFPNFLIAFVVFMVINSLVDLPTVITEGATTISRFALVIAIAAIGMKSNLSKLTSVGVKPIIIMVAETVWIALFILIYLLCLTMMG
ncbi:putative sulfate exporter family transporter [Thalassotalea euphylliae]|uniref:Putative sulfate exporter family transporter n=2 Tax=Thalassotalea euphylliae TaxID=1655234 RepID=A0A3E0TMT2_9GAMM|nr:putative sulfate exporter family transporter [Thalassotalea euphylliae]REL25452.1 putative sulfate exporter family transporter [Thalassotalea euphylliae]